MTRNIDWHKLIAGLLFSGFGGVALILASGLGRGNWVRIGPGAFPAVLGTILLVLGLVHLLLAMLSKQNPVLGSLLGRAVVLVPLGVIVFGLTIDRFGLIPAAILSTIIACLASRDIRFFEIVIMSLLLAGFGAAVFYYALGLSFVLVRGF